MKRTPATTSVVRRVVAPEAGHLERVGDAPARLEGQVLEVAVDVEVGDEDGVVLGQQGGGARLLLGALGRRRDQRHARPGPGDALGAVAGRQRVLDLDLAHVRLARLRVDGPRRRPGEPIVPCAEDRGRGFRCGHVAWRPAARHARVRPMPASRPAPTPGFEVVGRAAETAAIARVLALAGAGPTGLVLTGPAGMGKTTLLRWALAEAERSGRRVLVARPTESEAQLAFAGLADLLGEVAPDAVDGLPGPQARALATALRRTDGDPNVDPLAISQATLGVVRRLASDGPLVLALDDAPWLDAPTTRVLEYVVRRLTTEPVALIASVRTSDGDAADAPVVRAVGRDRLHDLEVGPLGLDAVGRMIADRFGQAPRRAVAIRIRDLSGGNPLYALELARAFARADVTADPAAVVTADPAAVDRSPEIVDRPGPGAARPALAGGARGRPRRGGGHPADPGRGQRGRRVRRRSRAGPGARRSPRACSRSAPTAGSRSATRSSRGRRTRALPQTGGSPPTSASRRWRRIRTSASAIARSPRRSPTAASRAISMPPPSGPTTAAPRRRPATWSSRRSASRRSPVPSTSAAGPWPRPSSRSVPGTAPGRGSCWSGSWP